MKIAVRVCECFKVYCLFKGPKVMPSASSPRIISRFHMVIILALLRIISVKEIHLVKYNATDCITNAGSLLHTLSNSAI